MKLKLRHIPAFFVVTFVLSELVVGESIMKWYSSFEAINLPAITGKNQTSEGSSTAILSLNDNAEITADISEAAQLSCGADNLVTEYKLVFDGDGSDATGGAGTNYETYDTFLTTAAQINYVLYDDEVEVTLHVRAGSYSSDIPDAGTYTATQTLTVHWLGP